MNNILSYIRDFFHRVDKWLLYGCSLYAALLITCNYTLNIENGRLRTAPAGWPRFAGFFALYAIAFIFSWLLLLWRRQVAKRDTSDLGRQPRLTHDARRTFHDSGLSGLFWLLLIAAPAIFALKVSFPGFSDVFNSHLQPPWAKYYTLVTNLPSRLVVVALALAFLRWLQPGHASFWGLTTRNFQWKPYAIMLLVMVPLIAFASTQHDFLRVYPKLRQVFFLDPYISHTWPWRLLFEISYGLDFVTIELFFRGFLVFAFVRYVGPDAIVPMAVFYCSIHFGKPLFECVSSFFGGMLLGIVAYRTRSILGGLMVHLGIAWMMELGGYVGNALIEH
jgi:hypothetical protein